MLQQIIWINYISQTFWNNFPVKLLPLKKEVEKRYSKHPKSHFSNVGFKVLREAAMNVVAIF